MILRQLFLILLSFLIEYPVHSATTADNLLLDVIIRSNKEGKSDKALEILRQGYQAHLKASDSVKAAYYQKLGTHYGLVFQIDSSRLYLNKAKSIVDNKGNWGSLALEVYNSLGNVSRGLTRNEEAIVYFNKALSLLGEKKDQQYYINESRLIGNIAGIYYDMQRYNDALKYARRSFEIVNSNKLEGQYLISNLIMAFASRAAGELEQAITHNQYVLDLVEADSSLQYYKPHTYYNLGSIYVEQNDLLSARANFLKAISSAKRINEYEVEVSCLISLANISLKEQKLAEANRHLLQANRLADQNNFIHKRVEILTLQVEALSKIKRYKEALEAQSLLLALNDSLKNVKTSEKIDELNTRYETAKKEQQIAQLEQEKLLKDLESSQQKQYQFFLITIAILLIAAIALLYNRYQLKAKTNKQLEALNFTKDRLFSIISHDLKSPLSSFYTITKGLTDNWERIDKQQLKSFIENLRDSSKEVHDMMDNLLRWALNQTGQLNYNPSTLDAKKVIEEVTKQLQWVLDAQQLKVNLELKTDGKVLADPDYLKIIIRNLLSNAIKFSEMGRSIDLIVEQRDNDKVIAVRDYGVGLSEDDLKKILEDNGSVHDIRNSDRKGTGLGLNLSKELMKKMGGYIEIESEVNRGSLFKLVFPKAA